MRQPTPGTHKNPKSKTFQLNKIYSGRLPPYLEGLNSFLAHSAGELSLRKCQQEK